MPEHLTESQLQFRDRVESMCNEIESQIAIEDLLTLNGEQQANVVTTASKRWNIWGFFAPEDLGGFNPSMVDLVILYDTLASHQLHQVSGILGPNPGILAGVGEPLKSNYLKPLLTGEKRTALAFTESQSSTSPTEGIIEGDALIVNGLKSHITGGQFADFLTTHMQIESLGPRFVVIDRDTPGVEIVKVFQSSDGSSHAAMSFSDVRVPTSHIIEGSNKPRAIDQISRIRLMLAAQSIGLAHWVVDYTSQHIQSPHRSGKPLASREGVRLRFSDMRIEAFAIRSMVYRTARIADLEQNSINEIIASKVYATETVGRIVDSAIQLVGGKALRSDHPLDRIQRTVRSWRLVEGANDILRLNLVRGILDLGLGRV